MARKPRFEFEGAIYHIISRGNDRKDVFEGRSAAAFEKTIFETCEKCGWRLHAYVIMSNHYHMALETPGANLVDGMRWLQGTFGNRLNACRKERGQVFQSRYKSLVIEEGRSLLGLVNYIHLNPVRAGMVPLDSLREYASSSFPKFFEKRVKEPLVRKEFLAELEFPDTAGGMRKYTEHLEWCEENDGAVRDELARRYTRGWVVASKENRRELKKMLIEKEKESAWGGDDLAELREAKWERVLHEKLEQAGKTMDDAKKSPKSTEWKVKIAGALREYTTATNLWIADRLAMGHPSRVRNLIKEKL